MKSLSEDDKALIRAAISLSIIILFLINDKSGNVFHWLGVGVFWGNVSIVIHGLILFILKRIDNHKSN